MENKFEQQLAILHKIYKTLPCKGGHHVLDKHVSIFIQHGMISAIFMNNEEFYITNVLREHMKLHTHPSPMTSWDDFIIKDDDDK